MKTERDHALETKARLSLMKTDLDAFTSTLKKAKKSEYEVILNSIWILDTVRTFKDIIVGLFFSSRNLTFMLICLVWR